MRKISNVEHICFFPGHLDAGGVGRVVVNFTKGFVRRGAKVDVFVTREGGVYADNLPRTVRVFGGAGDAKKSVLGLARYLRQERPDALYAARPHLNIVALISGCVSFTDCKVVVTEHSHVLPGSSAESLYDLSMAKLTKYLYPLADAIVAVSCSVARSVSERMDIPLSDVDVVYNPIVDPSTQYRSAPVKVHRWLRGKRKVVVGVGRLTKEKEFSTLISAIYELRKSTDAKLLILGDGEERQRLQRRIDRKGMSEAVEMVGHVDNPTAYMRGASVVALPSRSEGFGNVLVEAMAVGTPVVATQSSGGPVEILEDGRYGPLVPPGDPMALAEGLQQMIERPVASRHLRRRACEFTIDKSVKSLLGVLSQ